MANAVERRAFLPESRRTAGSTGAPTSPAPRATSRICAKRSTSDALEQRSPNVGLHLCRRVAERLPDVQRPRRRYDRRGRELGDVQHAGGRPTQYKFGFSYMDRNRDFLSRRFHFIPITTQKADAGNLLFDNTLPPEQIFIAEQHRHRVALQRGDAPDRCVHG